MSTIENTIQQLLPDATEAEVTRFINAYGDGKPEDEKNQEGGIVGNYICALAGTRKNSHLVETTLADNSAIVTRLKAHLEWRNKHGLLTEREESGDSTDASRWDAAVKQAWKFEEANGEAKIGADAGEPSRVPIDQVLFFHRNEADSKQIVDKNGKRILHLLPGLINTKAGSASFYANCIAYYLDRNLDRNSMEKITIMIDVREGTGWPNVPAYRMVGFLKTIVRVFESNFPERVHKFVAFPVPLILKGLVNTIKMLFDPTTAKKLTLATGSALADSPLPKKDLSEHIDEDVLDQTEKFRLSLFKEVEKSSGWFSSRAR